MPNVYAFRDKKSGVLSNFFVSNDPWSKVQQSISISLLELSLKDRSNLFVLFSDDFDLVHLISLPDVQDDISTLDFVNCAVLLTASRKAYVEAHDHTSPSDELDKQEE